MTEERKVFKWVQMVSKYRTFRGKATAQDNNEIIYVKMLLNYKMLYICKVLALSFHRHSTKQGRTIDGDLYHLMRKTALQQKSDLEK